MLKEQIKESEESIRRLSIVDRNKLYAQIRHVFGCANSIDEISSTSLHNLLWKQEALTRKSLVLEFCVKHNLIKKNK